VAGQSRSEAKRRREAAGTALTQPSEPASSQQVLGDSGLPEGDFDAGSEVAAHPPSNAAGVTCIETKGSTMNLHRGSLALSSCSVCLRVLWGGKWIEAATAIHELRSYERSSPPRLKPALCATCEESLLLRRLQIPDGRAA